MSINAQGADWMAIRRRIDERTAELRAQLEAPGLDMAQTEATRGRIAELRELIEFGEPRPMPEMPAENYS